MVLHKHIYSAITSLTLTSAGILSCGAEGRPGRGEEEKATGVDSSAGEPRTRSNIRAKRWSRLEWWEGLVNALCKASEGM